MSTSLTKKEQIYAVALGLGFLMEQRKKGDQEKIMAALRILQGLVDDDDRRELLELVERGGIVDDDFVAKAKENMDTPYPAEQMLHEIPKRDRWAVVAIGMAKLLKSGAERFTKAHKRLLKAMVTEEDVKWCQDYMRECLTKCGCDECKKRIDLINKVTELDKSGGVGSLEDLHGIIDSIMNDQHEEEEKQEPPVTEETWPDDPWKAFGA